MTACDDRRPMTTPPGRDLVAFSLAAATFAAGARLAREPELRAAEIRSFHLVNRLPAAAYAAVWPVMQLGSLGGALAVAGTTAAAGRRRVAGRIAVVATVTWAASKAVKPYVRRGRPDAVLRGARILGRDQTGLGYPSGHAAVALAVASTAGTDLPPSLRHALWWWALSVGPARVYVGAHLPLDVIGGLALGTATASAARVIGRGRRRGRRAPRAAGPDGTAGRRRAGARR